MIQTRENKERINKQIMCKNVRIVGDENIKNIISINDALIIAEEKGVDLVQISVNDQVAICKLIDYNKYLYIKKMKQKEQSQKNKKNKLKEIKFSYNIGEHDFNFKLKHAENFLKNGDKVRAYIIFKGRDISNLDNGKIVLLKFVDSLSKFGKPEYLPKLEGKKLMIDITPIK